MPRIRDAYLDCAIYLYASETDAEDGSRSGGSGFLVGIPATDLANVWFIYAVTNRHIVEKGNVVVRMKTIDGKNSIIPTDERAWIYHPAGDDIAICFLYFDRMSHKFNFVSPDSFIDKRKIAEMNMGPGDETFIVGRFINHEGKQQNLPTVRFGCVAQMPIEPVRQDMGFEQESFLVEARSIGGYSGSPVFLFIPAMSPRENVENWNLPPAGQWQRGIVYGCLVSHGPWLLGVDWGHINDWEPVRDASGQPVNPRNPRAVQVKMNTGLMAVVPAWKLAELLGEGTAAEYRQELTKQIREEHEINPTLATSG